MWEKKVDIRQVHELRCRTRCFFGVGAISKIDDIAADLRARGIGKVLIMTGRAAYKASGAWAHVEPALKKHSIEYVLYDRVTPNPDTDSIDEAVKLAGGAGAVIGIGGGSPIDAAKSAAVILANPGKTAAELYSLAFEPQQAAPIIAINLTHGTGTEVNRFAVATITVNQHKPAIAYECMYPLYSIDDPSLMKTLPADQTRFVSIDAVNHVVEAATTAVASPYSVLLAKETVHLVGKYLPQALKDANDLTARYFLLYASAYGGICFDNSLLHYTHALEHPLSAVRPELAHGLGLSVLLPAVVRHSYPTRSEVLAAILSPIVPGLTGAPGEAEKAAGGVRDWLVSVGVPQKLGDAGFDRGDIDRLVELAFTTPGLKGIMDIGPFTPTREVVRAIYEESF